MRISLIPDSGYASDALRSSGVDGTTIDKPFVFLTGPNGSGKSALLRGIRASIGVLGERAGQKIRTEGMFGRADERDVPARLDLEALGWNGQDTHLFDSRETSALAKSSTFDEGNMLHHVSMIAGGGSRVSHGQFVSRDWWSALEWAVAPSEDERERWLLLDEPETAIDAEKLIIGFAALLEAAEPGRLRVFCASHSLLFASGLTRHEKIQTIDLGERVDWVSTARIALDISADAEKLSDVGRSIIKKLSDPRRQPG